MARTLTMHSVWPALVAVYLPFCATEVRMTPVPVDAPPASLWQAPADIAARDLFYGPWGPRHAPDADDTYRLVQVKHSGVNPGLTVVDSRGREWSVKQAFPDGPDEGPVEVVVSRLLSAVGYHQPPVYYLSTFTLTDDWGSRRHPGGRFRLKLAALKDRGSWSWQQNPFVGTRPYQGLLAILMLVNSTDLKNGNNTLYEHRSADGLQRWYVTRDLGAALGTTGRLAPAKGDADAFARDPFITGVRDGFVKFDYGGWHQELVRGRVTVADLEWAAGLLAQLSDAQWRDAFRAGGYQPEVADRFVRALQGRIGEARRLADATRRAGAP
jgi:hypothetical protein